jgi:hypothetical protein
MSMDEAIRAFGYFLMFPAFTFFALIAFNRKQWLIAASYALLSAFFLLLLAGLVLRHYYAPIPALLTINTTIVAVLTLVVTWRATALLVAGICQRAVFDLFCFPEVES